MTATERLRELLNERGVEYQWTDKKHSVPSCEIVQWWSGDDVSAEYIEYHDGSTVLHIHASMLYATPEQAVASTLGDVPRLPHFWTHDGVLHVELPKLPESISVRLPDQRDREVGSARVWQYTLSDADATPTRQGGAGTLTAERVQELMEDNSRQYPSPTDPYVWLTEYDWQAIADELNATLGAGTCHDAGGKYSWGNWTCSECGFVMPSHFKLDELGGPLYRFCPNCGRKVVDE